MDPKNPNITPPTNNSVSIESELAHVTQEMYRKNVELNDKNKTLSLLRKIDVIILSSVTDPKQTASQVAKVIVDESDFKGLIVYEFEKQKNSLIPLAAFYEGLSQDDRLFTESIDASNQLHVVSQTLNDRKARILKNLSEIPLQAVLKNEANILQTSSKIDSALILPMIVRGMVGGVIVILLDENFEKLSESKRDILNRLTGVVGIAIDNALLYKAIQDANEKLKSIDKLKDEFVSLASHELRTPMTVIKSYIWLLLQGKVGPINEKQKTYLDRTFTSTNRLINMVNDMLNISRIESGRLTIDAKPMDMEALIKDVTVEMQPKAAELGISLIHPPIQSPIPIVFADDERIKQVLINLIGNSLKFTPQNGSISLILSNKDGYVLTQVKDTGKGIKAEDMEKLFKKFNMLGSDHLVKQTGQGTGLGLYLSKSLVELQKGRIWVESEGEGKGSTFSFTLPIATKAPAKTTVQ